jgi:4-amino-4-deoxy-L-arabinose transferase-like glycosyltransferase
VSVIKRDLFPLLLILGLAAILRFCYLGVLPLTGAEARAWQMASRPDTAYLDGPAGNALLVRAGLTLWEGPPGEAAIRAGHAAAGVAAVLTAYLLGLSMFSGPAGLLAAALVALGTPFALASRHVSEAAPQLALLLLTLALAAPLWTAEHAPPIGRILAAGLCAALLLNVGIAGWLLVPALLVALAVTRPRRLRQGPFWIFCLVALLGLAPWVLWNRAHANVGWQHLALQWAGFGPTLQRAAALVDLAGLPVGLLAVLAFAGLGHARNRALLVLGLVFLAAALVWPGDPQGPLVCGLGLLLVSLADGLHRWADRRLSRQSEWFPLRSVVPTLLLAVMGLAGHDAVTQTMAPDSAVLYRAASEAIYQETEAWMGFPRVRTATWRHHLPAFEPGPWLVLEDGLAAQMAYYMDVPVYGLDAQTRMWGIPGFQQALLASGPRIDRDELTWHLRQNFGQVEGPAGHWLHGALASPYITLWRVSGPLGDPAEIIETLSVLRLEVLYD